MAQSLKKRKNIVKYFVKDLLQKGCTNYYKMCYSMCNVRLERFLDTETLETDTQERREKRKDMKKKNAPIKVVAISSIAVLALAGISTVSILSLAKSPDGAATSGIQNAGLDTASAKAALREDPAAEVPTALEVAGAQEQVVSYSVANDTVEPAPTYTVPVVFEAPAELVVMSSKVEVVPSPEDVPVIATVQHTETVKEVALAAAEEQKEEPAAESAPVLQVVDATVDEVAYVEPVEQIVPETPVYEVQEPVAQVAAAFDYDVPEYAEPENTESVVVEPVAVESDDTESDYDYDYDAAAAAYNEFDPSEYSEYLNDFSQYDVYANATVAEQPEEEVQQTETISGSPASTSASGLRQQIVDFANSRVGVTPYVWAGRSLDTGTDCSGFVNLVYNNFGLYASSGSDDYQDVEGGWGENISYNELQPGDVVVYRNGGHVGIYAGQDENGNDLVIHDSNEIDGVKVSDMNYSAPTAFVRVAGMDAAPASEARYTDEEEDADDWYYAYDESDYDDEDESDYSDDYSDYDSDYDDEDYGYWN